MSHLAALLILALAGLVGGVVLMVVARGDAALTAAGAGTMAALAYPAGRKIIETTRETKRRADDAFETTQTLRRDLLEREQRKQP